ncbi:MAG: mechanosensitive ion channel family protein [Prolixibacteraceae bacterium]
MRHIKRFILPVFFLLLALFFKYFIEQYEITEEDYFDYFSITGAMLLIISIAWIFVAGIRTTKKLFLERFDTTVEDNLRSRKFQTQFNILERIVVFLIVIIAFGLILMLFEDVKQIGISLFASAGVAGIIIGFAAQRIIAAVIAGLQIAITQPIRLDDVVIIEGEWGRIEEITLTYVVVRIWDLRRLIVPSTYISINLFRTGRVLRPKSLAQFIFILITLFLSKRCVMNLPACWKPLIYGIKK